MVSADNAIQTWPLTSVSSTIRITMYLVKSLKNKLLSKPSLSLFAPISYYVHLLFVRKLIFWSVRPFVSENILHK